MAGLQVLGVYYHCRGTVPLGRGVVEIHESVFTVTYKITYKSLLYNQKPKRSQRLGRKNSFSQWSCDHDQGEPYYYHGIRFLSTESSWGGMRCVRLNFAQDTLWITKAPQNRSSAITNLRLSDDSDAVAVETITRYKIEFSAKKIKLMTNSTSGIQREIKVKGNELGTKTSFRYFGAVVSGEGTKSDVLSRIAQATAALTKLKPIYFFDQRL